MNGETVGTTSGGLRGGGIAEVLELEGGKSWVGRDEAGRRVVLKELDSDCLMRGQLHPMIKDRLERVRDLAHLGVAQLFGVVRDGERALLVWEYVEGKTL